MEWKESVVIKQPLSRKFCKWSLPFLPFKIQLQFQLGMPSASYWDPIPGTVYMVIMIYYTYSFFVDGVSLCCPGWSPVAQSLLAATSNFWVQAILLSQPPE